MEHGKIVTSPELQSTLSKPHKSVPSKKKRKKKKNCEHGSMEPMLNPNLKD